jgi:hypothetical protein
MRFSKTQFALCEGAAVLDLIGGTAKLLFVGINPGLRTVASDVDSCRRPGVATHSPDE